MPPVIAIVGRSSSGKTTLIERLVAELVSRGRRVAVIKHSEGFELDTEGKDTWRFSRAGAAAVAISSPGKTAAIRKTDRDLSAGEVAAWVGTDCDLVLAEGFKKSPVPKIEVHRKEQGHDLLSAPQQLVAVVTDERLDIAVPQFSGEDVSAIADIVEKSAQAQQAEIEVQVNGSAVSISPQVKDMISRTLVAMMLGVRGVDGLKSLRISLRKQP